MSSPGYTLIYVGMHEKQHNYSETFIVVLACTSMAIQILNYMVHASVTAIIIVNINTTAISTQCHLLICCECLT